jgi:hypothetical protein
MHLVDDDVASTPCVREILLARLEVNDLARILEGALYNLIVVCGPYRRQWKPS